jgi:2-polyprenyl-6-methoxyphenol hydroxylase-like FAD-dependent oxidoreductase
MPAIKADWYCLVFVTTGIPEMGTTDMTVINGPNHTHLFALTPSRGFFSVYFRLDKPCLSPKRPRRFTDQDADELAASVADHPLSETVVFAEVWKHRMRWSIVHLEEGVLDHWHHGRIALAGDSAHKVSDNIRLYIENITAHLLIRYYDR